MAIKGSSNTSKHNSVVKTTKQGGNRPKTSAMNKSEKRSFKASRGQGR